MKFVPSIHFQIHFLKSFYYFVQDFTMKFVLDIIYILVWVWSVKNGNDLSRSRYLGYICICFGTNSPMYVMPYHIRGACNLCLARNISHIYGIRSCDIIYGFNGCCSLFTLSGVLCFSQKPVIKPVVCYVMAAPKIVMKLWDAGNLTHCGIDLSQNWLM